jgi:hypothetical protein
MNADIIAARRQHIRDSAPCEGCGDTLANCKAQRGQDPTAPAWFGCCAQGIEMRPCRHVPEPGALSALLDEIESGTVRTVEEVTSQHRPQGMSYDRYFDQGEQWKPNGKPMVAIADMDDAWRHNAARWLERNAAVLAAKYAAAVHMWFAVRGPDSGAAARAADPEGWIRTTALYRALVADLPSGEARDALAVRARHYSTCPARIDDDATCNCHLSECAIRDGRPELGCTCRDTTPEWTL